MWLPGEAEQEGSVESSYSLHLKAAQTLLWVLWWKQHLPVSTAGSTLHHGEKRSRNYSVYLRSINCMNITVYLEGMFFFLRFPVDDLLYLHLSV